MSREIDALVAEKVIGWRKHIFSNFQWQMQPPDKPVRDGIEQVRGVPNFTTDPAADYEVLKRVRETWASIPSYRYLEELARLWSKRGYPEECYGIAYQPGDYSRAALAALGVEVPDDR